MLPLDDDSDVNSVLTISNVTTKDAGIYECFVDIDNDNDNGAIVGPLTSERLSVCSKTSLLVPVSEEEFFVIVVAGQGPILQN